MVQGSRAGHGLLALRLVIVRICSRRFLRVSSGIDGGIRLSGMLIDQWTRRLARRVRP